MSQDDDDNLNNIQLTCAEDSHRWFPNIADDFLHHVLGLGGECGEVLNKLKKIQRGDANVEELWAALCEELVDVLIYLCNCAQILGFPLADGFWEKRVYNERRFGENSPDQSNLATEIRRHQQGAAGASAFVRERDVQIKVQPEAPG
jgi:NTP pyrophosphatase (non-canonical NTP hydrolase)